MTPEEYAADQELYSSDLPFINRILAAIQRFERTRKLSPERRDIFYKYLAYGGVDVSPNMFQSVADLDQSSMDKDELAMALSKVSIGSEEYDLNSPTALFTVDFLGCMQGFLSRHARPLFGLETHDQVVLVTTTLERFMDYLLQHDVCPEYKTEVRETRDLCRTANGELWACSEAYRWLPGDFNIACSTLFGGIYSENYDGEASWNDDPNEEATFVGMAPEQAMQIVKFGIAGAASEAVYQKYLNMVNSTDDDHNFEVVSRKQNAGFTIIKVFQPTKDCIKLYKMQSSEFRPVGRIVAKTWVNPDAPPEDLPPIERSTIESRAELKAQDSSKTGDTRKPKLEEIKDDATKEYVFFIELPLISQLRVGMHLEATIHELNCGIWWFDDFRVVYPSFDTYLTNDLMVGWKEPRWMKGSVEYEKEREREEEEERIGRERAGEKESFNHPATANGVAAGEDALAPLNGSIEAVKGGVKEDAEENVLWWSFIASLEI